MAASIMHVVGARPNFMKCAPVVRCLREYGIHQIVVHTGQHFERGMSEVFFEQLQLPEPDVNLGVGSGTQATQTANLLLGLEPIVEQSDCDLMVVYGDVNSTLAGALTATKLGVPVAHVEAGLRSFDMGMPEEVNRKLTDQVSELLFVTSPEAMTNLGHEGVSSRRVHFTGNPMIDTLERERSKFDCAKARHQWGLPDRYAVATFHRPGNVDQEANASSLVAGLRDLGLTLPVVIPLHPRGRAMLESVGLTECRGIHVVEPMGYIEFMSLLQGASVVVTDSGGVQEETTALGVPCLTVRPSTERPVTVSSGTNQLVRPEQIPLRAKEVLGDAMGFASSRTRFGPAFWDGHAGERIAGIIEQWCGRRANPEPSDSEADERAPL